MTRFPSRYEADDVREPSARGARRADTSSWRALSSVPDWVAIVALALVGGGVPLVIAWHFGALGIPRNDDWAFLLSVFRLADDHEFYGYQWGAMNLVGQLALALPTALLLGRRIAPLQVEVLALGVAGLVAVYDVGKHLLSRRAALFVALMVAVGPLWAALGTTFMTDIPGLSLTMVCLAFGVRAVRPDGLRPWLFFVSLAFGLLAFSIREYTFVAPLAVGIVAVWTSSGRDRRGRIVAVTGVLSSVVVAVLFREWARQLPGREQPFYELTVTSAKDAATDLFRSVPTIGVLVAPAVLLARPGRLVRNAFSSAPRTSGVIALALAVVAGEAMWHRTFAVGNYLFPNGILGTDTMRGSRPPILHGPVLALLALIGVAAFSVLVFAAIPALLAIVARVRRGDLTAPASPASAVLAIAVVGNAGALVVPSVMGNSLQDRYLLPLVPLVGILVVRAGQSTESRQGSGARAMAVVGLAGLATLGLVFAANSASFDATKWDVARSASQIVGDPLLVDGGFEWDNYHAERPVFVRPDDPAHDQYCVVTRVEADRPRNTDETVVRTASVWGIGGPQAWIVARKVRDCPDA